MIRPPGGAREGWTKADILRAEWAGFAAAVEAWRLDPSVEGFSEIVENWKPLQAARHGTEIPSKPRRRRGPWR
jgi:hypothetical protein